MELIRQNFVPHIFNKLIIDQSLLFIELLSQLKINLFPIMLKILSMAVLGFNFPPDSGEKVTLEITVLMSLTMFMNMVSSMQPPSSETPLIGTA